MAFTVKVIFNSKRQDTKGSKTDIFVFSTKSFQDTDTLIANIWVATCNMLVYEKKVCVHRSLDLRQHLEKFERRKEKYAWSTVDMESNKNQTL